MKMRLVLAVVILAFVLILPAGPAGGACNNDAVVIYHAPWLHLPWFEAWGNYEPQAKAFSTCFAEIIVPRVDIWQPTVSVYLKKYQYDPSLEVLVELWRVTLDGTHWCEQDLIMSTTFSTVSWETGVWRWVDMFEPDAVLWHDQLYAIKIGPLDANYIVWGYNDAAHGGAGGFPECEGHACYSGDCDGVSTAAADSWMGIMVQGCWSPGITVITQDGYINSRGAIVMGGLVTGLGVTGDVDCYIDYGMTESLGNRQYIGHINTLELPEAYYNWELSASSWPGDTYCYFQAYIEQPETAQNDTGDIKTVLVPSVVPQISCEVVANDAYNCTFQTMINSLGGVEDVNLVLYYGQNWSCYGSCANITMFYDVTEAGVYNWADNPYYGLFSPGETYFFYAEEQTTDNVTIVRSDVRQFRRYDANAPPVRNWLDDWLAKLFGLLGMPPISGWWLLAFVVFLLVFFIGTRAKNWRAGIAWGMIAGCVLLYVLVAFDLVDPWLVVLLSIVAGYGIYRLLFAPARGK